MWRDPELENYQLDLSSPPSGGKVMLVLFGILVPLVIGYFATKIWIEQETVWWMRSASYGRRYDKITLRYEAAQWMATLYFSVALFFHSRWCWGILGREAISKWGMVMAMISGLIAGLMAFVYVLGG